MKRILIASFIVVACVLVSVISLIYIESTCADMIETTDKAIASIMTQDLHQLRESLSESIKMLEKSRGFARYAYCTQRWLCWYGCKYDWHTQKGYSV